MDVSAANAVNASLIMQQAQTGQDQQMLILKKALDAQASEALQLIQSVTPTSALATEGSLGTQVNTYA